MLQGEKIQTILKAAAVDVEPYWPGLFAKALEGVNIKDLITNVGSGIGSGPAVAGGAAPAAAAGGDKKEEKKEEKKAESEPESDDDMGFGKCFCPTTGFPQMEEIVSDDAFLSQVSLTNFFHWPSMGG